MNKQIYIDFDGVIVDSQNQINELFRQYGNKITAEWNNRLEKIEWKKEILPNANEINNSFSILRELYEMKKEVHILSRVFSKGEANDKAEYLKERGIFIPFIPSYGRVKKSMVVTPNSSRLLVDDSSDNIIDWNTNNGQGFYFTLDEEYLKKYKNIDFNGEYFQNIDGQNYFKNSVSDLSFLLKKTL